MYLVRVSCPSSVACQLIEVRCSTKSKLGVCREELICVRRSLSCKGDDPKQFRSVLHQQSLSDRTTPHHETSLPGVVPALRESVVPAVGFLAIVSGKGAKPRVVDGEAKDGTAMNRLPVTRYSIIRPGFVTNRQRNGVPLPFSLHRRLEFASSLRRYLRSSCTKNDR